MIYLDYQATTPLAPEARATMLPWLGGPGERGYGNPHSPHRLGREADAAVEVARGQVARALGPQGGEGELYFTSGATEAVNWAIKGTFERIGRERPRIVTIATEHACVLDTVEALGRAGADMVILPVDQDGLVDMDAARAAIDTSTAIVAAMLVNNEIGTIGPVAELGALARAAGAAMLCDAVQGFGRIELPTNACDLIAISAHKIHGPKGIGALWVRDGFAPEPLMHGGGQEGGIRSGTLSPALCAGFGAAAALATASAAEDHTHVARLHARLRAALGEDWIINGGGDRRYPGNLNIRRAGLDAGRLISEVREVALSAGSACASGSGRPSHVLRAIGLTDAQARSSIRLGFGRYTTEAEIDEAAALIDAAAARQLEWA
jgi:cysteine desulfurase